MKRNMKSRHSLSRKHNDIPPLLFAALKMIGSAAVTAILGAVAASAKEKILDPTFEYLRNTAQKQLTEAMNKEGMDPAAAAKDLDAAGKSFQMMATELKKKKNPKAKNFEQMAKNLKNESKKVGARAKKDSRVMDSRLKRTIKRPSSRATSWEIITVLGLPKGTKVPPGFYGKVMANGDTYVFKKGIDQPINWKPGAELDRLALLSNAESKFATWDGPERDPVKQQQIETQNEVKLKEADSKFKQGMGKVREAMIAINAINQGTAQVMALANQNAQIFNNLWNTYQSYKSRGYGV